MQDTPESEDLAVGIPSDAQIRREIGQVDLSFFIIGVGASAGGLDAIKQLIGQAPAEFPHTFVIIQHISPDYKSLMAEILGRETQMPVMEVLDDMALEPGHIYLIPPKSNVIIQGTEDDDQPVPEAQGFKRVGLRFSLVPPVPRPQLNLPIDLFFHSLSEAVGDRAISVILSGLGSDGSRGMQSVKDRGGFVMVQEPSTATFDGMPNSALSTNLVDVVASPDAFVGELLRYISLRDGGMLDLKSLFAGKDDHLNALLSLVEKESDINFSQYKKPTLMRRIARRVALNEIETLEEYYKFARDRPHELKLLHREFLVGVTNFFRDLPSWTEIREKIIPELFEQGDQDIPVKVWSAGCSTGEEAYTIAMLMEDYRRKNRVDRQFRIFATDVNEESIRSAKEGVYPDSVIEEFPEEFQSQDFLTFHNGSFHISKAIRSRVIFSEHNVLEDPPYINTDMVTCRNLMIYLSPEMQKRVLSLFSFSIRKDGVLFLGAAEHVARHASNFDVINSTARIYRNVRKSQRSMARANFGRTFPMHSNILPRGRRLATRDNMRAGSNISDALGAVLGQIDGCLLVIEESGQILDSYGNYREFVTLPERAFSSVIFDVVADRLKSAVSLLLRKAQVEGQSNADRITWEAEDSVEVVDLHCVRVEWDNPAPCYALLFQKSPKTEPISLPKVIEADGQEYAGLIARLEGEIEGLQEMLSLTAEDLGVTNEELQTTNEELTVSNEELQANNEEMQSTNEELHTVNAENVEKIAQLEMANADIENLLDTADLGVLFLDDNLAIRRFNLAFTRYVDLTETDFGRKLSSFSAEFIRDDYAKLLDDVERAREHGAETVRDLICRDGSSAQGRARPFVTNGVHDGVVVSIIDTTRLSQLTNEVKVQRDRLSRLLESESAGYWDWDIPGKTQYLSPRFKSMFGYDDHELENKPETWMRLIHPDDLPIVMANYEAHTASHGEVPYDQEVRYRHKNGSIVWVQCRGRVVEWDDNGDPLRLLGVHMDITRLKEREALIQEEAEDARRFAFAAAHDLLQPMTTIERGLRALSDPEGEMSADDQAEVMHFLEQAATRMRSRIHGVIDFAQVVEDGQPLDVVDLNQAVTAAVGEFKTQIEDIGAEVLITDLPEVLTREQLVPRLFQNLLSNALKYRKSRGKCQIVIEEAPAEPGMVAIRVMDNGIGIPEDQRNRLFKMFSRLHTEEEYEGIGVGLALCQRIMALSDGRINLGSGIGKGAGFVCTFKCPPESAEQDA